jgi:opacity protein-like surface antigen
MLNTTLRRVLSVALTYSVIGTAALHAQLSRVPQTIGFGIRGINAQPLGEFKRYVKDGWGIGGDFRYFPGGQKVIALRADLGLITYGRQTTRECFGTGCRISVDVTTSNNIISGLAGPELQVPSGPLRPYVNAMAGLNSFLTQSSADGQSGGPNVFQTTNYRDNVFSYAMGGGVRIPVGSSLSIDVNARRNFNGRARYLTRDSFGDGSNPNPVVRESETNMWTYAIGVSFGR